jgi:lysophospholipase L1-like esterase
MRYLLALVIAASAVEGLLPEAAAPHENWTGTWASGLVARAQPAVGPPQPNVPPAVVGRTIRQIVRVSIGGQRARVVFSNAFGSAPLIIGAAAVARRQTGADVMATAQPLTFSGSATATIPQGAALVSDPVSLSIPPLSELAIDLYVAKVAADSSLTVHNGARQTNYVSEPGNHAGASPFPVGATTTGWFFLARVDVASATPLGAVVAIGDSITDGYNSTLDANSRWPDQLANRLMGQVDGSQIGVLNVGIDGNRLLVDGMGANALARFDRDVIGQAGATHVVVLEGINDLGLARREGVQPPARDLIAAHRQLIARARSRGLRIFGATLLPYEGTTIANYYSEEGEAARKEFNQWLRISGEYDGIIDFERAAQDPTHPARLRPDYDSGDHLHPSDSGYRAMASAVDLSLFATAAAKAASNASFGHGLPSARWAFVPLGVSKRFERQVW